jgi:uncharacterized OsmC-like protein
MSQAEIGARIRAAIDYLNANPTEARYSDPHATARLAEPTGLRVEVVGPAGAHMATDMPVSVGGTNTTASPGWYLRAAEASCVATLIAMRAAQQGLTLRSVEVTVDSESDDRGILGADEAVPSGPLSTRVAARVRADASEDAIRELVDWAVAHCPVTDAVRRAVPMTVEVEPAD